MTGFPMRLKRWAYRRGFRPKQGNPFYSPCLAFFYGVRDAAIEYRHNGYVSRNRDET